MVRSGDPGLDPRHDERRPRDYGVDPVAFIVIYLASVPFFYYSIFRMVRALAQEAQQEIMLWSMIFLAATAAPFLYVLFFGRNLPWWVYVVIALLIGQGVYSLIRRLRKKPSKSRLHPAAPTLGSLAASTDRGTRGAARPSPPPPPGAPCRRDVPFAVRRMERRRSAPPPP